MDLNDFGFEWLDAQLLQHILGNYDVVEILTTSCIVLLLSLHGQAQYEETVLLPIGDEVYWFIQQLVLEYESIMNNVS